jgi:CheY-like chemotaxis protein
MSEPAQGQTPLHGLQALVVEDETIVAFLIEDMLTELGCSTVRLANTVNAALAILAEHRPDIAVLDVNLSGADAYVVAERLAADKIPFVFATGYGRDGISERWADQAVVQKPFQFVTLEKALQAALKK